MANEYKNELLLKLAGQEILLRPTFENIAAMEAAVGGLGFLAWKFSRAPGVKQAGLADCAQIIFCNQAATNPDDVTKKLYSLEDIWQMVMKDGYVKVQPQVMVFIAGAVAGDDYTADVPVSENQKKS